MVPVGKYTSFGLGGTVRSVVNCGSTAELLAELQKQKKGNIETIVIAGGSNVIFPDGYLDKTVIRLVSGDIHFEEGNLVIDAGLSLDKAVEHSVQAGRAGLESLSYIPGSVGGAVVGNAGAYGQTISDHLVSVSFFDGYAVRSFTKSECAFSYRSSIFKKNPEWIVLMAVFNLPEEKVKILSKKRKDIGELRLKKYPLGLRCPGSFFKNIIVENLSDYSKKFIPEEKIIGGKVSAGFLLETIGACGDKEGGIYVASYHGNLLINNGAGTTIDSVVLSSRLSKKVFNHFGIQLEPEVVYIS